MLKEREGVEDEIDNRQLLGRQLPKAPVGRDPWPTRDFGPCKDRRRLLSFSSAIYD